MTLPGGGPHVLGESRAERAGAAAERVQPEGRRGSSARVVWTCLRNKPSLKLEGRVQALEGGAATSKLAHARILHRSRPAQCCTYRIQLREDLGVVSGGHQVASPALLPRNTAGLGGGELGAGESALQVRQTVWWKRRLSAEPEPFQHHGCARRRSAWGRQ